MPDRAGPPPRPASEQLSRLDRHLDETMGVVRGLRNGDLEPLSSFLSKGGLSDSPPDAVAVPRILADELVAMIRRSPSSQFHLVTKGRKKGERGWSKQLRNDEGRWRIGYFAERRTRESGRGCYDSVIEETSGRFGVEKTAIDEARKLVKTYLKRVERLAAQTGVEIDGWEVLSRRYSADFD